MPSDLVAVFPVEIFEEIIDQSSDRDGSLCRLSLTCHAFLPRARLNLFFHIHIAHKEKLQSAPAFLQARLWLPPLVHAVTIRDYVRRYPFKLLLAVVPSRLVSMLPNLRSMEYALDWRGLGSSPDTVRLYTVYSRLEQSILRKSCTSIWHLELTQVRFRTTIDFVQLLCALPNLKSLICRGIYIHRLDDDTSLIRNKPLHLTHLDTDGTFHPDVLELLLTMGQDTLENLSMAASPPSSWERYEDGTSLEYSAKQQPMVTLFSRLRHLQTLTLSLHDVYIQNAGFITLEFATEILNNIVGALQCLNVVWSPQILAPLAVSPGDVPHHLFKTFEESITRLPLRQVVFSPPHYRTNRRGLWRSALDRVFPSLKERGILQATDRPLHLGNRRTAWLSETPVGHYDHVSSLVVSPNGRFFASSSYDSTIILWNAHQGTIEHEWVGHDGQWVCSLAFSPDSRYLLSGGDDGTLQVWDTLDGRVKQGQVLGVVGGTEDGPNVVMYDGCGWSADGMWIASRSGTNTVHLWDGRSFHRRRTFEEPVTSGLPSLSPDSRWLVWLSKLSDASAEYFCVWDALAPDAPPRRLPAHSDDPLSTHILPFDPSSKRLVTTHGAHLRVWDVITGAQLAVMGGHSLSITTASFSPDGRHILSASHDGTAKVWDAKSGECMLSLEGHEEEVNQALFSPDGNYIATGSDDTTVRLWKSGDGSCLATFADHEDVLKHIVFSPDGKRLASGDDEGVVHIRDISHIIGQ